MDKEPITVSGLKNLKSELEDLKNVQRPNKGSNQQNRPRTSGNKNFRKPRA